MRAYQINAAAKRKAAAEDRIIETAYRATCSGIQINVMDIGKVFAHGRTLLATSKDLTELALGIRAFVETIRQN